MNKRTLEVKNNQTDTSPRAASLPLSLWLGTCARYTILCMILLLINAVAADGQPAIDPLRFFLLLPFALCLTLAASIRRTDKLATGGKCVLHPILFLGGFYLCCYLPFQVTTKPSGQQVLLILLLVSILYGACMGIFALVSSKRHRKAKEEIPYVSQYSKK